MSITVTLSPTSGLSLSSDRPISDAAWRAASAVERAQAAKRTSATGRVRVGRITMKPSTAVALMARTITDCALSRGEVTRADFERIGLTSEQIDAFQRDAYTRAALDEPRIVDCLAA